VQPGQLVSTFGAAITQLGRSIAPLRRFEPRSRCFVAHR
jgi:hypothetical protein